MSNSSLVTYTKISPNKTAPRNHTIDTITIHCMAGNLTIESCGNLFARYTTKASSNYGIGADGRIGLYVEEKDRSWASSNKANDMRAVTIEVASDSKAPYKVSDKAYQSLIKLVADICKRNGIKKLVWSTDKNTRVNHLNGANMTVHRDFANKACPGDYLYNLHGQIAKEVNAILGVTSNNSSASSSNTTTNTSSATNKIIKVTADSLNIRSGAGTTFSRVGAVKKGETYTIVEEKKNGSSTWGKLKSGAGWICLTGYTTVIGSGTTASTTNFSYNVMINVNSLNVRAGAGTNYKVTTTVKKNQTYTIVEEKTVSGVKWGKLKSGAGWIALSYTKKV